MIIPWLAGIKGFRYAPMTWILVALNILIYLFLGPRSERAQELLEAQLNNPQFVKAEGYFFSRFIFKHENRYSELMRILAGKASHGNKQSLSLLAGYGLQDQNFHQYLELNKNEFIKPSDPVALATWTKGLSQWMQIQQTHPSFVWGLKNHSMISYHYLTYQFIHGNTFHILSNMVFLLLFGCFLEPLLGASKILGTFLVGGVGAAVAFLITTETGAAPLVGASGSLNGLVGVFAVFFWQKKVSYYYFLLPFKEYVGKMALPGWIVVAMWLLSDLAGSLSCVSEFGGIAYSAHLGGLTTGLIIGVVLSRVALNSAQA